MKSHVHSSACFPSSLKNETIKTVEGLDQQIQEQEKLRQNARIILSIIQRTKVQLIELRPTMNDEADQKLRVCFFSFFFPSSNTCRSLLENRRRSSSEFRIIRTSLRRIQT